MSIFNTCIQCPKLNDCPGCCECVNNKEPAHEITKGSKCEQCLDAASFEECKFEEKK